MVNPARWCMQQELSESGELGAGYVSPICKRLESERLIERNANWSSAPRHLGPRDRLIGWAADAHQRNIGFVAYNSRYLILPWVRVPHLALHLLGRVAKIYRIDAAARKQGLSADERLRVHQKTSGPIMGHLKKWLGIQLKERNKVEPNSTLGTTIAARPSTNAGSDREIRANARLPKGHAIRCYPTIGYGWPIWWSLSVSISRQSGSLFLLLSNALGFPRSPAC